MSNSKDDATTFLLDPAARPATPPEPGEREPTDQTVIMKPSQRAREAAAALKEQRRREAAAQADEVDFDVTAGEAPPPAPPPRRPAPRSGPGTAWKVGFVIGAMMAAAAIGVLVAQL
ncbi:MAG: hypothetical protein RLW61_19695 [Gammaproteobacteria bacterium]